jgi:hypothetical protein
LTPKARRLHLIQAHNYPKEYFFAVTNKGVGGLLEKWGEGVSLIRREWKPREMGTKGDEGMDLDQENETDEETAIKVDKPEDDRGLSQKRRPTLPEQHSKHGRAHSQSDGGGVDDLVNNFNSLNLVPTSIRFGRGGRKGGFKHEKHLSSRDTAERQHGSNSGEQGENIAQKNNHSSKQGVLGQSGRGKAGLGRGISGKGNRDNPVI